MTSVMAVSYTIGVCRSRGNEGKTFISIKKGALLQAPFFVFSVAVEFSSPDDGHVRNCCYGTRLSRYVLFWLRPISWRGGW